MSDIIKVSKNINGWESQTVSCHLDHESALEYVKTYERYDGRFGSIWGLTVDEVLPIDDSQEYIGWDSQSESLVFVCSNPDCYQSNQSLEILFEDGTCIGVSDSDGNEIRGLLEDWKND